MRSAKNNNRIDLKNATHVLVSNSSPTLVTAAANTKGVIIHYVSAQVNTSINPSLTLDGVAAIRAQGASSGGRAVWEKNILVGAGVEVGISCPSASASVVVFYEVL